MAWRIEQHVVRGEIDNRIKDVVQGRLWLAGRADPLELHLVGNACADLAGCLLTFTNKNQALAHPSGADLHPLQRGTIGDLTASRKNRVFDIPLEEALAMIRQGQKPPEHMANTLFLEWYSDTNGRVVLESSDYDLTISEPAWRLTAAEESERAEQASGGMDTFLSKLTGAIDHHKATQKDPEEPWDEHDYEKLLRESDARGEKYRELLEKFGDQPDLIDEKMGWTTDGGDALQKFFTEDEIAEIFEDAQNEEPAPDPQREGIDWLRAEAGYIVHPLTHRCHMAADKHRRALKALDPNLPEDPDVAPFLCEFRITSAKLAGALNPFARAAAGTDPAFIVACLKRALSHLHLAQAALESAVLKNKFPAELIDSARQDLFSLRDDIIAQMNWFRGRG